MKPVKKGTLSKQRLEAFSDGVFAIAITLLILEVAVPELSSESIAHGELLPHLLELWPKFLSYIISFAIIGIFWASHHLMFTFIKKTDRYFLLINILLLMVISFIPFPAALIGEYATDKVAVIIYGATMLLTGIIFLGMWMYASTNFRLIDKMDKSVVHLGTKIILLAPVMYAIAIALAFINPLISITFYILIPVLYIIPGPIDTIMEYLPEE